MAYIDCDKCYHGRVCAHRHHYHDMIVECNHHIPTADVVEVKHGEWIYHECVSTNDGAKSGFSCSECCDFVDEEIFDMDEFNKDFCGACGAKMDGGNNG